MVLNFVKQGVPPQQHRVRVRVTLVHLVLVLPAEDKKDQNY